MIFVSAMFGFHLHELIYLSRVLIYQNIHDRSKMALIDPATTCMDIWFTTVVVTKNQSFSLEAPLNRLLIRLESTVHNVTKLTNLTQMK